MRFCLAKNVKLSIYEEVNMKVITRNNLVHPPITNLIKVVSVPNSTILFSCF